MKSATFLAFALATLTQAQEPQTEGNSSESSVNEESVIEISKPHRMSRLISLETGDVLESFGLGFSGGGNLHKTMRDGNWATGSIYLGLGDVVELGYALEEIHTTQQQVQQLNRGHIKLGMLKESKWLPAASAGFGSTYDGSIKHANGSNTLDHDSYFLGLSKSFHVGSTLVGVHPSAQMFTDRMELDSGKDQTIDRYAGALGITWQQAPDVMFMAEGKMGSALDVDSAAVGKLADVPTYEANIGIRYFLRNWLFFDAGIRHFRIPDANEKRTSIHANITGVIPLRSTFNRITSW